MILVIAGGAAFMATMFLALVINLKSDSLKLLEKIVCRGDEKMEIAKSVASHHQPGEKSLEIYCNNYGKKRLVNGRTLFLAFGCTFIFMLPFSMIIVILIQKYFFN